jgi:hypothetical protein
VSPRRTIEAASGREVGRSASLGPFVSHYVDELLGDMNLETHRSESLLAEFFRPNFPSKYEGVTEERRRRGTSPRE